MSCDVLYSITYCFGIKCTSSYIQTESTAQDIDPRLSTKIIHYTKEGVTTDDITQINKSFSIFYRAKTKEQMEKENEPNSFLLVCQSKWQKYLLQHYGSELILLDATYKATRYSLPLFFLTVKTNVDY